MTGVLHDDPEAPEFQAAYAAISARAQEAAAARKGRSRRVAAPASAPVACGLPDDLLAAAAESAEPEGTALAQGAPAAPDAEEPRAGQWPRLRSKTLSRPTLSDYPARVASESRPRQRRRGGLRGRAHRTSGSPRPGGGAVRRQRRPGCDPHGRHPGDGRRARPPLRGADPVLWSRSSRRLQPQRRHHLRHSHRLSGARDGRSSRRAVPGGGRRVHAASFAPTGCSSTTPRTSRPCRRSRANASAYPFTRLALEETGRTQTDEHPHPGRGRRRSPAW